MADNEIELAGVLQFDEQDVYSLQHLLWNQVQPRIIEIGCWSGFSTVYLATWAKQRGGHVWSIDTFDGRGSDLPEKKIGDPYECMMRNLQRFNLVDTVTVIRGESDKSVALVPDDCTMLFIDGDHRYDQVKRDLDNYGDKIKHGIVCGHDLNGIGWDEQYINQDHHDYYHHGVAKAVIEKFGKVLILPKSVWVTFK